MKFTKMHGLGNDFMIIDTIRQKNLNFSAEFIKKLSNRKTGVGFDQLLIVESALKNSEDCDFNYRIFNSDGFEVEQCGNGARCFAIFVKLKGLTKKKIIKVSTKKNNIILKIKNNNLVSVNMGEPEFNPKNIIINNKNNNIIKDYCYINVNEKTIKCSLVSVGNPHCIIEKKLLKNLKIEKIGSLLENHKLFPNKINVGFMQKIDRNNIKLRVYERGVGETQSCGSGACAAVAIGIKRGMLNKKVNVHLLGGVLNISWKGLSYPILMTGPATHVYDGIINI